LKWFAPILSFTTEEIYRLLSVKKSIHLENFIDYPESFKNEIINLKWSKLLTIRNECNLSIEKKRADKTLGSSLEAKVKIKMNKNQKEIIKNIDLAELLITSSVEIEEIDSDEMTIETIKAEGIKCPVCWKVSLKPCQRHAS